jgi:TPR repeat protein
MLVRPAVFRSILLFLLSTTAVQQNFNVATYWLHIASKAGVPTAQYYLGLMYDKGQGVPQDFVLAHAWLNLAVAHAEPKLRSRWVLIRDAVASKMTEAQLFEARRLAYAWPRDP